MGYVVGRLLTMFWLVLCGLWAGGCVCGLVGVGMGMGMGMGMGVCTTGICSDIMLSLSLCLSLWMECRCCNTWSCMAFPKKTRGGRR